MAQHLIATYGYAGIFILIAAESLGLPLPGELTLLVAASYASTGHLNIALVIATAAVATVTGSTIAYIIGRTAGPPLLARIGHYIFLDADKLLRAEQFVARYGDRAIFVARFIAFLRIFAGLLAGLNRMPAPRFIVFNTAGGVLWAVLYGLLAYKLGEAVLSRASQEVGIGALVVVIAAAIGIFFFRERAASLWRRLGRQDETKTAEPPETEEITR